MTKLFFFYGSLRSGYWNQRVLPKEARLVTRGKTDLGFALYVGCRGNVPTCIPNVGHTPLVGEVWEVPESDVANIYGLEAGYECGDFNVTGEDGLSYLVPIFHHSSPEDCAYLRGGFDLIPSGDYTQEVSTKGERLGRPGTTQF